MAAKFSFVPMHRFLRQMYGIVNWPSSHFTLANVISVPCVSARARILEFDFIALLLKVH